MKSGNRVNVAFSTAAVVLGFFHRFHKDLVHICKRVVPAHQQTPPRHQCLPDSIGRITFERRQELIELSPLSKEISWEIATVGLPIPLHPGAEKYFKEKGILK